ncbi:MAG: signal peptidase I [Lachnospiraceae bacterium]|nr:signal peptidase I [Lachnospiraceae bacterium]
MAKSTIAAEENYREKIRKRRERKVLLISLLIAFGLGILVAYLFFSSYTSQEYAMDPTIEAGDRFYINRVTGKLTRGDLIAYTNADAADSSIRVRRVIGLPGETVQIRDGLIMIDGETYMEDLNLPDIQNAGIAKDVITVGSGEYFCLGDNRNGSEDSRFSDVGNISSSQIKGRVWYIAEPASRKGFVK